MGVATAIGTSGRGIDHETLSEDGFWIEVYEEKEYNAYTNLAFGSGWCNAR
jgi:hypothetical protein